MFHVSYGVDLQRIKQYIRQTGDRFVFVEDGEPSLVVMSFRDYERLLRNRGASPLRPKDSDLIAASFETERIQQQQKEADMWELADLPLAQDVPTDSVRLEDLPL